MIVFRPELCPEYVVAQRQLSVQSDPRFRSKKRPECADSGRIEAQGERRESPAERLFGENRSMSELRTKRPFVSMLSIRTNKPIPDVDRHPVRWNEACKGIKMRLNCDFSLPWRWMFASNQLTILSYAARL